MVRGRGEMVGKWCQGGEMVSGTILFRPLRNSDWKTPCAAAGAREMVPDTIPAPPTPPQGGEMVSPDTISPTFSPFPPK
jgi:hypothetical protein